MSAEQSGSSFLLFSLSKWTSGQGASYYFSSSLLQMRDTEAQSSVWHWRFSVRFWEVRCLIDKDSHLYPLNSNNRIINGSNHKVGAFDFSPLGQGSLVACLFCRAAHFLRCLHFSLARDAFWNLNDKANKPCFHWSFRKLGWNLSTVVLGAKIGQVSLLAGGERDIQDSPSTESEWLHSSWLSAGN